MKYVALKYEEAEKALSAEIKVRPAYLQIGEARPVSEFQSGSRFSTILKSQKQLSSIEKTY